MEEHSRPAGQVHRGGEDIPRRARQGRDDRPVAAGEGVEQGALADVGPAGENDAGAAGGLGHVAGLLGQAVVPICLAAVISLLLGIYPDFFVGLIGRLF